MFYAARRSKADYARSTIALGMHHRQHRQKAQHIGNQLNAQLAAAGHFNVRAKARVEHFASICKIQPMLDEVRVALGFVPLKFDFNLFIVDALI